MSEYRQDCSTGEWVIVAPGRAARPHQTDEASHGHAEAPDEFDPACPFCPGNEDQLLGILDEVSGDELATWRVRVVPNKYPALEAGRGAPVALDEAGLALEGFGRHEVIVETPRHDEALEDLPKAHFAAVVETYWRRFRETIAVPGIRGAVIFRNHGPHGGATLAHPHSQLVASALPLPGLTGAANWGRSVHAVRGTCATCGEIHRELRDGSRVVEENERFVVLVPFAPKSPCQQWILPRRHQASFAEAGEAARAELAEVLQRALRRQRSALGNPGYNYAILSGAGTGEEAEFMHWGLRIVPSLTSPGGFELGGGLAINPSSPEEDAALLRAAEA